MKLRTFAERYCECRGVPASEYHQRVFRETLYPQTRPLVQLLRLFNRRYFVADFEFVEDAGHLTSLAEFSLTMGSYVEHPDNRGLLRRQLRLRVSAGRMLQLMREVFDAPGLPRSRARSRDTLEPFPDEQALPPT
jgi:hypothetical protein